MNKFQEGLRHAWYKFKHWFNSGGDGGYFNSTRFFLNILYLIISFIITAIIFSNLDFLNGYELFFVRIGSLLFLIGIFFMLRYIYYMGKQLKRGHASLRNGHKVIIAILIIIALIFVYINQVGVMSKIKETASKFSISDFNPTTITLSNSTYTLQKSEIIPAQFTNFLPQPWGFLIILGILVIIVLLLLRKFVFKGRFPTWLIWVLVIIGIILLFQYKLPYDKIKINDYNTYCNEAGQVMIKDNLFGFGQMLSQMSGAVSCMDYKSSQCRPICQGGQPYCQCEANLIDIVFHQKGDWILGGGFP